MVYVRLDRTANTGTGSRVQRRLSQSRKIPYVGRLGWIGGTICMHRPYGHRIHGVARGKDAANNLAGVYGLQGCDPSRLSI